MPEKFELPKFPELPFAKKKGSNPNTNTDMSIEDLLPAPPPNLPLPHFMVRQMHKQRVGPKLTGRE